ncbi:MAG TPA: endonuclease/exonuclease/phosphatase family protein [Gemmataceae bacterium]|nr:endonuclease/exonuclease/phosphatase family protein [Gemmataceae bacterium]
MSNSRASRQIEEEAIRVARRYPRQTLILLVIAGVILLGYYVWKNWPERRTPPPVSGSGEPATFLFCSWNVENLFDDEDDPNFRDTHEDWLGSDPAAFRQKVDHLADGLLKMNGGVGPDIACLVEVESERAVSALKDAVNAKLEAAGHSERKFEHALFKKDYTGRRIAPAILTRVGVEADRTRKLGKSRNGRILEGHLHHNGHELVVIVAHWTSRVTDKEGDGSRRVDYAEDCYGRVKAILHENPDADVIVCGDFNDEFTDRSIQQVLHASASADEVRNSVGEPRLLDLFANWSGDPPGTIYGRGKWSVFDHICVTRGVLDDRGWSCDPGSATIFAPEAFRRKRGARFEPFEFGSRNDKGPRGYSDHFPVTVQLNVAAAPQ